MIEVTNSKGLVWTGEIAKQFDMRAGMIGQYFSVRFYTQKGKLGSKYSVFVIPDSKALKFFEKKEWKKAWDFNGYVLSTITGSDGERVGNVQCVMFASNMSAKEADKYVKTMCDWQLRLENSLKYTR